MSQPLASVVLLLVLVIAVCPAVAGSAVAVPDPYSISVFEGRVGPETTARAQIAALRQVLVRVTGLEAAGRDEALIARIGDPARLLLSSSRDSAGNLALRFDAVALAERIRAGGYALRGLAAQPTGAAEGPTRLDVQGLRSFADYGRVMRQLQGLAAVGDIQVLRATKTVVELSVDLRTDVDAFWREVRLQGQLEPVVGLDTSAVPVESLALRLRDLP